MLINFSDLSLTGVSSNASNLIFVDSISSEGTLLPIAYSTMESSRASANGLEGPFPFPEHPEHIHDDHESGSTPPVASGDQNIDALLVQSWDTTDLTYSFPTAASNYLSPTGGYTSGQEADTFEPLNAGQIAASREIFEMYEAISGLSFTEITETDTVHADYRLAESDSPNTAWGYYPWSDEKAGDSWFNKTSYNTPDLGSFAYHTFIHELGHNSGLKHGHQTGGFGAMTADRDSMEFSIMTYRSYVGHDLNAYSYYTNAAGHFAQTLMMYDIAALQHHYGANFDTNSGDTVYTFSSTTGEMMINGVGVGAPVQNVIFRTIWDGDGVDTYDFSNYATNLSIDLTPGGWSDLDTAGNAQRAHINMHGDQSMDTHARAHVFNALQYDGDARSLIENAEGGAGNDTINGNVANNALYGNGGADTLYGVAGDDVLFGGAGDDVLVGGADNDTLYGGVGADALYGGDGVDTASYLNADGGVVASLQTGGTGGDANGDTYSGIENLRGSVYTDTLYGDANDNVIWGVGIAPPPDGRDASDIVASATSADNLFGGGGNDTLYGGTSVDNLYGGADDDVLYGDRAPDQLHGDGGDDVLFGGSDNDTMFGGSGHDTLYGGSGSDLLYGDTGGDVIVIGDDRLFGGAGNDSLEGRSGADFMDGGEGVDTAVYSRSLLGVTVNLAGGHGTGGDAQGDTLINIENVVGSVYADSFRGDDGDNGLFGGSGDDVLRGLGGRDTIRGGSGADNIRGGASLDTMYGDSGNDFLFGEGGDDTLFGGTGEDRLFGEGGDDALSGGGGRDVLLGGIGADSLFGGAGDDVLRGGNQNDQMYGGDGSDLLLGSSGDDVMFGGTGNDSLLGGANDDTLYGGVGDDMIRGGSGADILVGGGGQDFLFGQGGADTFVFNDITDSAVGASRDRIVNFESTVDTIDLSGIDADTGTGGDQAFSLVGSFSSTAGELVIIATGGGSVLAGDVDGDGSADFQITVTGDAPVAGDFVL